MKLVIKGRSTVVGGSAGKSHINWKTGIYVDGNGEQQQLSSEELEALRRERNRMHAKMTRDRKKMYINSVEKTIRELEAENTHMKELIAKQAIHHAGGGQMSPDQSRIDSSLSNQPTKTCSKGCQVNSETSSSNTVSSGKQQDQDPPSSVYCDEVDSIQQDCLSDTS